MTDKTIINGVDVSGCLFIGTNGLTDHKIPYCRQFTGNCKAYPNCYFKQCARKDERIRELENRCTCEKLDEYGLCKERQDLVYLLDKTYEKLSQIAELCDKFCYKQLSERIKSEFEEIKQIAQGE